MSILARVRNLELPLDQLVVIGSGILDALGLRSAGDIDLVVSEKLFNELSDQPDWSHSVKHGEAFLTRGDTEVFMSWGNKGIPNFRALYDDGMSVEDVKFAHPEFVVAWKQRRLSDKDKSDIALLKEYLKV